MIPECFLPPTLSNTRDRRQVSERMDTWFQTKESPGPSRGASPRTPRRLSDGEGLFDTFEEDARWDGADRAPNVLRPPTPVAERATAAPQSPNGSLLHWGSLLGIVAPQPARAVAEGSGGRGQTSDAVLERAAVLVQRLTRGKIARLDAAEVTRRFKLLELYVRCAPRPYAASRLAASRPTPFLDRRAPRRMPLWSYSATSATGIAAGSRGPR